MAEQGELFHLLHLFCRYMFDQYLLEVEKLLADQGPFLFDQDLLGLKGGLLMFHLLFDQYLLMFHFSFLFDQFDLGLNL